MHRSITGLAWLSGLGCHSDRLSLERSSCKRLLERHNTIVYIPLVGCISLDNPGKFCSILIDVCHHKCLISLEWQVELFHLREKLSLMCCVICYDVYKIACLNNSFEKLQELAGIELVLCQQLDYLLHLITTNLEAHILVTSEHLQHKCYEQC